MEKLKILILEDNPDDSALLQAFIKRAGIEFEATIAKDKQEFIQSLETAQHDIILSDHSIPGFNSLEALRLARQKDKYIPLIIVTGTIEEKHALQLTKEGANDYILKNNLTRLPFAIEKAMEFKKMKKKIENNV